MSSQRFEPFTVKFVDAGSNLSLELYNTSDQMLRDVEILTVFLKDDEIAGGGPSRAHIKFEAVKSIHPKEQAVLAHRTWIDGKPANLSLDQLARLKIIAGGTKPYVLDISWQDAEGKSRFQRTPVGH
ncbi:MAG: hypothetical protein WKF84_27845 [Pyrinomonadaceae bacterium]